MSERKVSEDRELYMRYLGVLALLGEAMARVRPNDDLHDSVATAMEDAQRSYPVICRQTLCRWDVEPDLSVAG